MSKEVVIIGAGGHGKVVADIVVESGDKVKGFLDDHFPESKDFIGYPILGRLRDYMNIVGAEFVIAIGNAKIREKIARGMKDVQWYTAIHPKAVISSLDVRTGEGTVVMANAVINPGTHIGRHCIINSGAIVEHDNVISDFVHISVGAKLAGTVSVGNRTWIGIGAVVSNNLSVCQDCMIGAGAVVVNNIKKPGTYIGIPAKEKSDEEKRMDF